MIRTRISAAALTVAVFTPSVAVDAQPAVEPAREVELYEIDAERSEVYWLIYRAGTLARFGHNHVISAGDMAGQVLRHPEMEQSRFEIEIPADTLVVDDPDLRAREREQFDSVPSDEDIEGTRRNMLSEDVLDAARYPIVRVTGIGPTVHGGEQTLEITIELLGRSIPLTVPTAIEADGELLEATGAFRVTHEMLGMRPFSALMGALQVDEPIDFKYRIAARRIE